MKNTRYKILLIEDDKLDQMAFNKLVEEENLPYDCTMAGSVSEAKCTLSSDRFDVVIVDYMLGDGTAFDVLDLVKDTPIIFVTGAGDEAIAVEAQRAGAYDYLIKDSEQNYLGAVPITVENAIKHKKMVEELRLLSGAIMSTEDSVYITDMENKIIFVNKAFCESYGYKKEEIIGEKSNTLWIGKDQCEHMASGSRIGGSAWQVGFYHKRKDGSVFPVSLSTSTIEDENGSGVALVGVARDISDSILVEDELKTANKNLKKQTKLKSELAIMVSETLMRLLSEEHIDRARGILSDFLDISKVDEGKMKLKLTKFGFRSAVSEVLQALSPLASEKSIDLKSFVPHSDLVVEADYDRIVQVLTNLINNSIKTTASNGCVRVQAKDIGYQIAVEVQDDGPTIGSGQADEIFDLFAQIEEHLRSDKEDLALGLPLAKELVEMHGGCIWAETGYEQGNSFCFTLPKFSIGKDAAFAKVKAGENLCLQS